MSLGENMFRAFEVVNKTHENVRKLIDFCKVKAEETGEFELRSPKFLRYKSDTDYWGWNTTRMFLVFQDTQDKKLRNGWRNGPLYVFEICLYDPGVYETDEPRVEIAKFEYEDMKSFSGVISVSDYWRFQDPLYCVDYEEPETGIFAAEMPEEMSRKCWGVKRVVCKVEMLTDVTYDNAYDMVFGTFKHLKNVKRKTLFT